MVKVRDDLVVDRFTTLVQPPPSVDHFSPFCVSIHGITSDQVRGAPTWPDALAELIRFADGQVIVAHNAAFDMGVIRSACSEMDMAWPELHYACSLVIARRTWSLLSYSLPWVAEAAGHTLLDHHDPTADASAAAAVMIAAKQHHGAQDVPALLQSLRVTLGRMAGDAWNGCHLTGTSPKLADLPGANPNADPDGPLYGLTVCFTGTLASMTRSQAWQLVAEAGGQPLPGVTKHTDLLVIGDQDPRKLVPGATMSSKQKKAAALLDSGRRIEMISEHDFPQRLAASEGLAIKVDIGL